MSGPKYPIQERVIFQGMFSIDEVHNKALKIDMLQSIAPPFRHSMRIEKPASCARVEPSSMIVERPPVCQSANTFASAPSITTIANTKSKANPYANPRVGKCYILGKLGQRSNECPKRKQVNLADYENDKEEEVVIEDLHDLDFVEE